MEPYMLYGITAGFIVLLLIIIFFMYKSYLHQQIDLENRQKAAEELRQQQAMEAAIKQAILAKQLNA